MAFSGNHFTCPVCQNLLNDPVTLPCGRSYCKVCIKGCWDQEDVRGVYSCPQCRETFTPRPVLRRNNMLSKVVEKLKKTELQASSSPHCYPGPGDVKCDFCTETKHKAVKMEEHKGHETVTAKTAEQQNKIKKEQMNSQQRIQEKQRKMQELKQTVAAVKMRSQAAVVESERIFTELISLMEKKRSEVTELIRAQEKAELSKAEELLKKLKQEIADLRIRVTELEQLSHTHDHIHILQSFQSLCVSPGCEDSPQFNVNQHLSFDGVRKSVSDLKKQVEEICEEEFNKIHSQAVQMISLSEPKSREDFLQYFCYLTLDSNTSNRQLLLSEKNRVVTHSRGQQLYPDHPERFDSSLQVLCEESVCGRCYWEVEWSGGVYISVSYKGISRKGHNCFGCNSQSWSLACSPSNVSFQHNNILTRLQGPASSRIGVYVDHIAGTLSFYSVSDMMSLLHRVHTTFTQPLYAGFCLWDYDSPVRLCDSK